MISVQLAGGLIALAGLTFWPPASGRLLLVPLTAGAAGMAARAALDGGALLLGAGPFPQSLVVDGDRSRLAQRLGRWDILVMAAPNVTCGGGAVTGNAR